MGQKVAICPIDISLSQSYFNTQYIIVCYVLYNKWGIENHLEHDYASEDGEGSKHDIVHRRNHICIKRV